MNNKELIESEIIKHLKKSEEDIENEKIISAEELFRKLREEYKY